jgi:hypothetical protein
VKSFFSREMMVWRIKFVLLFPKAKARHTNIDSALKDSLGKLDGKLKELTKLT